MKRRTNGSIFSVYIFQATLLMAAQICRTKILVKSLAVFTVVTCFCVFHLSDISILSKASQEQNIPILTWDIQNFSNGLEQGQKRNFIVSSKWRPKVITHQRMPESRHLQSSTRDKSRFVPSSRHVKKHPFDKFAYDIMNMVSTSTYYILENTVSNM